MRQQEQTPAAAVVDWTNAKSANGPKVAKFFDRLLAAADRRQQDGQYPVPSALARRLYDWRRGGNATFFGLDGWLCVFGVHPSELPADVWQAQPAMGTTSSNYPR